MPRAHPDRDGRATPASTVGIRGDALSRFYRAMQEARSLLDADVDDVFVCRRLVRSGRLTLFEKDPRLFRT